MRQVIPFNRVWQAPYPLASGGEYGDRCARWLEERVGGRVLMTHSATGALEIAMLLADVRPGDEVILPSWTFVSTATAVVAAGGVPVFVDVDADTLTIDPEHVAAALTPKTRAIIAVHYAGVGADMKTLIMLAVQNDVAILEDAAQGLGATYRGEPLGGIGQAAALSFHETKNLTCGEGGALVVKQEEWFDYAERVHGKGTDRARFLRGETPRYTWTSRGGSYGLGEIPAAFLWSQMDDYPLIQESRRVTWEAYHEAFAALELDGRLRRPVVPRWCKHNAHIYYVLLPEDVDRARFLAGLWSLGVHAVFHFVPLHSSPAGQRFGRTHGDMAVTDSVADRIVRLPLWAGMTEAMVDQVVEAVAACS